MIDHLLAEPRPLLMGILNLTPDSFSDGLKEGVLADRLALAEQLMADGADLLDIGGESTRPGAEAVSLNDERARVLPFLDAFRKRFPDFPLSLDTTKPELAQEIGRAYTISILNDVSCLTDEALARVAAALGCYYVLMHSRGTPRAMTSLCDYPDGVVTGVQRELHAALQRCCAILPRQRILLDLGFGFAKTAEQNRELLASLSFFRSFDLPIVLGISRKRFLTLFGAGEDPRARDKISAQLATQAVTQGARILRVHDVKLTKKFLTAGAAQG